MLRRAYDQREQEQQETRCNKEEMGWHAYEPSISTVMIKLVVYVVCIDEM